MKKLIFVCLLTISVCLSEPTKPAEAAPVTPPASAALDPHEQTKAPITPAVNSTPSTLPSTPSAASTTPNPGTNDSKPTTIAPVTPPVVPTNTSNATTDDKKTTTTTPKPDHSTTTTTVPTTQKTTTEKAAVTTEKPHTLQARGFDGASFVGGIILTLGLLAIGFMGFKYYKAQTERNYHTL